MREGAGIFFNEKEVQHFILHDATFDLFPGPWPLATGPSPFTLAAWRKAAKSVAFFLVLLLLACGQAWARVAGTSGNPSLLKVSGGGIVHAGQVVSVTWNGLPSDTDEFELLLQCETPGPLTLRLTECEEPAMRAFSWHVPDGLPSLRARIVLRRGEKGRELLWARSEPFQISAGRLFARLAETADTDVNIARVSMRDGELWLREEAPRPGRDEHAGGFEAEEFSGRNEAALQPGVVHTLAIPASAPQHGAELARAPIRRPFTRIRPRKPSTLQLRI